MTKEERINELRAQFLKCEQEWKELQDLKEQYINYDDIEKNELAEAKNKKLLLDERYKILKNLPVIKKDAKKMGLFLGVWTWFICNLMILTVLGEPNPDTHLLYFMASALSGILVFVGYKLELRPYAQIGSEYTIEGLEDDIKNVNDSIELLERERTEIYSSLKQIEEKEHELMKTILKINEELCSILEDKNDLSYRFLAENGIMYEDVMTRVRKQLIQGVE